MATANEIEMVIEALKAITGTMTPAGRRFVAISKATGRYGMTPVLMGVWEAAWQGLSEAEKEAMDDLYQFFSQADEPDFERLWELHMDSLAFADAELDREHEVRASWGL